MQFINYYEMLKGNLKCKLYNEDQSILELQSSLNVGELLVILKELPLMEILTLYNESMTINISSEKVSGILTLDHNTYVHFFDDFELLFSSPSVQTNVEIKINKKKFENVFLHFLDFENISFRMFTFFEPDSVLKFFNQPLKKLDEKLFEEDVTKIIFFFPFLNAPMDSNDYFLLVGKSILSELDQIKKWNKHSIKKEAIENIIEKRNLYCNWADSTKYLIPEMFWFNKTYSDILLFSDSQMDQSHQNIVYSLCNTYVVLYMSFLSNYITPTHFKIIGHRSLEFNYKELEINNLTSEGLKSTFFLYSFIYSAQTQDKITICRNTISVNVNSNDDIISLLNYSPDIFNSVQNSFSIYMDQKLEEFLDKKMELEKHARDTSKEISDEITNSINLISRNLLAFIGVSLVGFLGYTTRDNSLILWSATIAYILFVIISTTIFAIYSKNKKDHAVKIYTHYSKINFYVDKTSKELFTKEIIDSRVTLFNRFWISSIGVSLLLILVILITTYLIINN